MSKPGHPAARGGAYPRNFRTFNQIRRSSDPMSPREKMMPGTKEAWDENLIMRLSWYAYLYQEVMIADGRIPESEQNAALDAFNEWGDCSELSPPQRAQAWRQATEWMNNQPCPCHLVDEITDLMNQHTVIENRVALVCDLGNIAIADRELRMEEVFLVNRIATQLGINPVFDEDEARKNTVLFVTDGGLHPHALEITGP